ncbi:metallophosphoesterase family protein [Fodinibius roseus]|uniref:metallophosphoesterase family protein n=1 Tax=Fodinibius roseus TaxID=1194090 RepID=UPI001B8C2C6B|nr:metallophosphoesterase [Fodinibius roseus]
MASGRTRAVCVILNLLYICLYLTFTGCRAERGGDKRSDRYDSVSIGLLPDTQGDGDAVSIHPMKAVLDKLQASGVDIVIPVGDLTNHGTTAEFDQWTSVAEQYRKEGIEFLPLMGNHETSYAYAVEWIEYMKEYIPEDAVHMAGAQYQNYYVVRENVLIVLLRYYNLPIAFQWIKEVVDNRVDEVDHIVIASHDGLIGAKYGETREMIVEGTRGDHLLMEQWDEIRSFFSRHDVIWVQGHEHMYQRSVISAPVHVNPSSWRTSDRNYRLPQYTQIVAGNASYKGYEFRYGEREKVQAILQQKMNTREKGSEAYDVNASVLSFDRTQVDFEAYFTSHTISSNREGKKELENPIWVLMDRFSRTTDRCERIVYPNSIPAGTRPVLRHDVFYRTSDCRAPGGSAAKIVDGVNNTFNRVESTPQTLSWRQGFSRAESQMDLMRLAYQYLFQYHQPWTPNLNSGRRLVPAGNGQQVEVPATTIDLKEHMTLSWSPRTAETLSDILIVSGTQVQTGMYSSAYGMKKNIEEDPGLDGSQPDGSAKKPHDLPESATKSWDITSAAADPYVLQFENDVASRDNATLAYYEEGSWKPFTREECVMKSAYESGFLNRSAPVRKGECRGEALVGFDNKYNNSNRWWVLLQRDVKVALVEK